MRKRRKPSNHEITETMSFEQMRMILSDEIRKLRRGDSNPSNLNAISNMCGKFLASVKTELELCRFIGRQPAIKGVLPEKLEMRKAIIPEQPPMSRAS